MPFSRIALHILTAPWRGRAIAALFLVAALCAGGVHADGHALLWRIDGPPGSAPNYILGTMHVSDPRVLDVGDATLRALDQSDTAVFEIIADDRVMQALATSMMYSDGRDLESVLGPDLFEAAVGAAQPYGLTPSIVRLMKPWALLTVLSVPTEESFRQAKGNPALDLWLQAQALDDGKALVGLETLEEQLAVFEETPEADQIALLRAVVENKTEIDEQFETMLNHYLNRDLAGLFAIASDQSGVGGDVVERFNQRIMIDRNDIMSERLLPMVAEGGHFIAVGAAHLPGENGILNQMRARGFTVTAIE